MRLSFRDHAKAGVPITLLSMTLAGLWLSLVTTRPDYKFKGVKSTVSFTIKPGPNNPVGAVWINLSARGYGIPGTPESSKVSKTESHGCIRLTNWDAKELAAMVKKGTPVVFLEGSADAMALVPAPMITRSKKQRPATHSLTGHKD